MGVALDPVEARKVMLTNGLEPLVPYPGAAKPWKVKCLTCGAIGSPTYAHVKGRGGGCLPCGRKKIADSKRLDPSEAEALFISKGYQPIVPFKDGKTPWLSVHLKCGNLVTPQYTNVAGTQGGCKPCGQLESARKRKLDNDEAIEQLVVAGFRPLSDYPGSKSPWKCECANCGEHFFTKLDSVRAGAHPVCSRCNLARMGISRRFSTADAKSDFQKVGLEPRGEFPGVRKQWACFCGICKTDTSISLIAVRRRIALNSANPRKGCEKCVFLELSRSRILDQVEAEKRLKALNMTPMGAYIGTFEPVLAMCLKCGTENQVRLGKAVNRGRACVKCSLETRANKARKPEEERNSIMLSAGFKPLERYTNSHTGWKSIHLECGRIVSPSLGSIQRGSSCAYCAKSGFDNSSPALLYVLTNPKLLAIKVGITGVSTSRLRRLESQYGWRIDKKYLFVNGSKAKQIERLVLSWWRSDLGLPIGVIPKEMGRIGGWTETAPINMMSVEETTGFIEVALEALSEK